MTAIITLTDEQVASIIAQTKGVVTTPPPATTPPPTNIGGTIGIPPSPTPGIVGTPGDTSMYGKVVARQGVFPGPAQPNQRHYVTMNTNDLLAVNFVPPANAKALEIAVSAQGGMRNWVWSISTSLGDFTNSLYSGFGNDLSIPLTTAAFAGRKPIPPLQNLYFNLKHENMTPVEDGSIVLFFQRPA